MAGRRRWLCCGGTLVVAAGCTALSTWRHWAGCRPQVSAPTCLALQEETYGLPLWAEAGSRDTAATALAAGAAAALALAWLLVIGWARASAARTIMAVIIGLQPLLLALLAGLQLLSSSRTLLEVSGWLTWPAEMLTFPLLLGAGWLLDEPVWPTIRLISLAWAVTSFGSVHHFVDYVTSSLLFDVSADTPPGLGYVTAATQLAVGLALVAAGLLAGRGGEPDDGDERRGQDGFTLAA